MFAVCLCSFIEAYISLESPVKLYVSNKIKLEEICAH